LLFFLILGIILISVLWKYKRIVVLGFCILFLALGIWHCQSAILEIPEVEEKEVSFVGIVVEEPDVREKSTKLTLETEEMKGKVLITVFKYPEYQYGDRLKVKGTLEAPQALDEFNYKDYLAKDGIYSVIYFPEIKLLERNQGNVILAGILKLKDNLRGVINQNLSPPQSSILAAMLLGDKRQISETWKGKLNLAGVRHLTAISGMHVAILTVILMSILAALGFWPKQIFLITILLISFFVIMTGFQSSAIRAGIMGIMFLLAKYLGRQAVSVRPLVFAASFMLVENPLLLRWDVGFQLSFLAVLGIIYFLPYFKRWLKIEVLAMTLAAQVLTLPILIFNFGYFSLVSPLTNVLIVPLLPFILGLGFLFAFLGMVFSPLGWLFSLPAWLLLTYLTEIVDFFSNLPFAALMFN